MAATSLAQAAQRHAALRWVGVPLFCFGLLGLASAIGLAATTEAPWRGVMLYVATTGLSLATFGTHNDTALAFARRAPPEAELGPALRKELQQELDRDRAALMGLSPSPNVALVITLVALTLHVLGLRWLLSVT